MPSNEIGDVPTKSNEALASGASDCAVQPPPQRRSSVYDFLYQDARRIGSFLAQFQTYGVEQSIKTSESVRQGTSSKSGMTAVGGVPLVAQGHGSFDQTVTTDEHDAAERSYDPLWRNALTLLDYLDEADLINRDITNTRIGQFVIASGALTILNAAVMREVWISPGMRAAAIKAATNTAKEKWEADPSSAELRGPARKAAGQLAIETAKNTAEIALDNLKHYPHGINCVLDGNNFSLWSPLREEGITGAATDISLMHGAAVPGDWNLLGILDALPSPIPEQEVVLPSPVPLHFAPNIRNFANTARRLLGRPPESYGMTALLLFRKVSP
jgi:hypothetical protein